MLFAEASSVGVIGGADGPTAVIVTGSAWALLLQLFLPVALMAYLLGSVNFGVIVSKLWYREDVRSKGSGNAGSTNMLRTYGKKAAIVTLLGDMGKGVLAVVLGRVFVSYMMVPEAGIYGGYVAAIFAVLGHLWPIWFKFKGGKGVATAAGAILASDPLVFLGLAIVFWGLALTTKIVSLSSVCAAAAYPILTGLYSWYLNRHVVFTTVCALIMGVLIIWMHRANIKRLLNGTEYKFGEKKK